MSILCSKHRPKRVADDCAGISASVLSKPCKKPKTRSDDWSKKDVATASAWSPADHAEAFAAAVEAVMTTDGTWVNLTHRALSCATAKISSCDYLKIMYPHDRDADCVLEESTHTYFVRGCRYDHSVTSVWSVFFPKFESDISERMLVKAADRGLFNMESSVYWLYMHLTYCDRLQPDSSLFWMKIEKALETAQGFYTGLDSSSFDKDAAREHFQHLSRTDAVHKPIGASCYFLVFCAGYTASDIRNVWQMHGNLESLKGTLVHKQAELFMQELALCQVESKRKHVPLGDALANEYVLRRAREAAKIHAAIRRVAPHVCPEIWDHPVTQRYLRKVLTTDHGMEFTKVEAWLRANPKLSPYRSEWSIYDENAQVAGQIDSLWFDESRPGMIVMVDWKRVRKTLDADVFDQKMQAFGKYGLETCSFATDYVGPCADMFDCAYNHYLVQQHLYAYILRLHYGVNIGRMMLLQCHPDVGERVDAFHEVEFKERPELAGRVLEAFVHGWSKLLET